MTVEKTRFWLNVTDKNSMYMPIGGILEIQSVIKPPKGWRDVTEELEERAEINKTSDDLMRAF